MTVAEQLIINSMVNRGVEELALHDTTAPGEALAGLVGL